MVQWLSPARKNDTAIAVAAGLRVQTGFARAGILRCAPSRSLSGRPFGLRFLTLELLSHRNVVDTEWEASCNRL